MCVRRNLEAPTNQGRVDERRTRPYCRVARRVGALRSVKPTTMRRLCGHRRLWGNVLGVQQSIPVVGEPIAYGIGFVVLGLVAFTGTIADSLVTVAHEGGHMLTDLLTGRGVEKFTLEEEEDHVNGATYPVDEGGWLSRVIVCFSGYPTPPLAGLGGAYVIAAGNSWGVLWVGIVLLAAALLVASGTTALVVSVAALVGVIWAAVAGSPFVQAAVAVGLVWLLLIGGLGQIIVDGGGKDGTKLSGLTWIPRVVWFGIFLVIAVVSLGSADGCCSDSLSLPWMASRGWLARFGLITRKY